MPHRNLKPCPNPHCRKGNDPNNMDIHVEKEQIDDTYARHRLTCRKCSYSSGWFDNFHEMVAWWNKYSRMPNKKKEE